MDVGFWIAVGSTFDLCVPSAAELSAHGLVADDSEVEEHSVVETGGL